eukprot:jgi/Botrbrau1/7131/Bobra.0143s0011.1
MCALSAVAGQTKAVGIGCSSRRYNRRHGTSTVKVNALFGFGGNDEAKRRKEEQWAAQQAVLARRRTGSWQKDVQDRRAEVRKYVSDPDYKKKVDEERRERKKAEQGPDPEVNIFNIIIPLPPFGIPEYDNGERFDLRLPYVDNGWVDEEADFGKTGAALLWIWQEGRRCPSCPPQAMGRRSDRLHMHMLMPDRRHIFFGGGGGTDCFLMGAPTIRNCAREERDTLAACCRAG